MPRRITFGASVLAIFFILAAMFAVFLYALAPAAPAVRGPVLLSAFIVILTAILLCILFFLRWMLRPYRHHSRRAVPFVRRALARAADVDLKLKSSVAPLDALSVYVAELIAGS